MLQRLPIAFSQVKAGNTIEKRTKWNLSNHMIFVSIKRNW